MLAIYAQKSYYQGVIFIIAIVLFSIIGMKSLFGPGLFTAHDIGHQVVRLFYYNEAINNGQFPPYWIANLANNFGYPLFLFSYHLPWLIGSFFMRIGLDFSNTIKTLFFLSYISSGLAMYFFVNNLLKSRLSAFLSSILYLWMPYHFLIIFVGASMGIAFVFTFLPLIFLGINLIREKSKYGIPIFSIGLSGLILSHLMHLIFSALAIISFLIWNFKISRAKKEFINSLTFGFILALLLSSFYLLPAAYYSKFTRVGSEIGLSELYKRNFINFRQVLYSKWGFSPIVNNAKNGEISFQLGIAHWISILSLATLLIFWRLKNNKALALSLLGGFAGSIFLTLDYSKPIWSFIVKFASIDFPFRFILPSAFIASAAGGLILNSTNKKYRVFLLVFLIGTAIYTNRNHFNVNLYTNIPLKDYLNLETERTTSTFNEYLPLKADDKLLSNPWNEIRGENLYVKGTKLSTNLLSFTVLAEKNQTISIGQFDFPGQTLYLDDKNVSSQTDNKGRLSFNLSKGNHSLKVKFEETPLIKLSKYLTAVGLLILFLLFFRKKSIN